MKRLNFKINNIKDYKTFIKIKNVKMKEETNKTTIRKTELSRGTYDRGFRGWHNYARYTNTITGTSMTISDSVGGCGIQHLYEWVNYCTKLDIGDLLRYIIKDLHKGVGLLTCQVGQDYNDTLLVKELIKEGFELIEYNNYQHNKDGSYKGYLYMLKIKKNDE